MSEHLATKPDERTPLWTEVPREPTIVRLAGDFFGDATAITGAIIVLAFLLSAVFAPWVAPHDPLEVRLEISRRPPAWSANGSMDNLLGTDVLGRDILSRIIFGSRLSLVVGFLGVAGAALVGTLLGLVSGYVGGLPGEAIMRVVDIQLGIPFIVLAIVIVSVLGPSLANVLLVFTILEYPLFARLTRGETLRIREREFVLAARAIGAGSYRLLVHHIFPNVVNTIIVAATLEIASLILYEAALGFLGLGVPPPAATWGNMLADGRQFLTTSWWIATFPGIAILLLVLGVNFVGDWVSYILDPRRRRL